MKKLGHTPGPWRSTPTSGVVWSDSQKSGNPVAQAYCPFGNFTEERQANAMLIAAAPEMLEALEKIRSAIVKFGQGEVIDYGNDIWDVANKAIAKARGEK